MARVPSCRWRSEAYERGQPRLGKFLVYACGQHEGNVRVRPGQRGGFFWQASALNEGRVVQAASGIAQTVTAAKASVRRAIREPQTVRWERG